VESRPASYAIDNADALEQVIGGSGLLGIFAGHFHDASVTEFAGIPLYTAGGVAFGLAISSRGVETTDRVGYNYCILDDTRLQVLSRSLPGDYNVLLTRPL